MVIGKPALSIRRMAARARRRVAWERRRAAATTWWELSARMGRLRAGGRVIGESGDDAVQIAQDLLVHLGQPGLPASLGSGDELDDLAAMDVVLGQEFCGGDEHRAGQAGVGVWACLLDREPAEP